MPLIKPFQLTRKNVHGDLNIGDAKEWFKTQYGQYLTKEDQLIILNFLKKFLLNLDPHLIAHRILSGDVLSQIN